MSTDDDILHTRCYNETVGLPEEFCAVGNICGFISSGVWFIVLLPQVIRNFRHRSVEGLSVAWAISNFTAALNNSFFCFLTHNMPLFTKISATYMSVLEFVMLLQFVVFTPQTKKKTMVAIVCVCVWVTIAVLQLMFTIQSQMEWVSIVLWGAETFPQIFLNMKRKSTQGLSLLMIILSTFGKTTDFGTNYFLNMPIQYVIMCYFSSTTNFISTLQVIFYWGRSPIDLNHAAAAKKDDDRIEEASSENSSPLNIEQLVNEGSHKCNVVRLGLFALLSLMLAAMVGALWWRLDTALSVLLPLATALIIGAAWAMLNIDLFKRFRALLC